VGQRSREHRSQRPSLTPCLPDIRRVCGNITQKYWPKSSAASVKHFGWGVSVAWSGPGKGCCTKRIPLAGKPAKLPGDRRGCHAPSTDHRCRSNAAQYATPAAKLFGPKSNAAWHAGSIANDFWLTCLTFCTTGKNCWISAPRPPATPTFIAFWMRQHNSAVSFLTDKKGVPVIEKITFNWEGI